MEGERVGRTHSTLDSPRSLQQILEHYSYHGRGREGKMARRGANRKALFLKHAPTQSVRTNCRLTSRDRTNTGRELSKGRPPRNNKKECERQVRELEWSNMYKGLNDPRIGSRAVCKQQQTTGPLAVKFAAISDRDQYASQLLNTRQHGMYYYTRYTLACLL